MKIVIMGVSGCGKTSAAEQLAAHLALNFLDADDFHNKANVAKMRAGIALTDADRADWLSILNHQLRQHSAVALACSEKSETIEINCAPTIPGLCFCTYKAAWR